MQEENEQQFKSKAKWLIWEYELLCSLLTRCSLHIKKMAISSCLIYGGI